MTRIVAKGHGLRPGASTRSVTSQPGRAIIASVHGPHLWHETRSLRNSISARRWRHGRGLPRPRHPLDRTVAVKILPAHLSSNIEAKQRFEREARAISSLNHPNICTLHDIGHQDGTDFLVMEYLEGETLADRLAKGPLSAEQVLKYGIDICEGLEKAHKSGVIHRDLKPGNIMLTKSGAKLMDFGLAKATLAQAPPLRV